MVFVAPCDCGLYSVTPTAPGPDPSGNPNPGSSPNSGAVAGGSVAAVAFVAAGVAFGVWRRRRGAHGKAATEQTHLLDPSGQAVVADEPQVR